MSSIYEFVKEARDNYRSETIDITDGLEFSQYETLRIIELYHNSKFTTGSKDTLGREKPFYNICKFRVNVAVRATDLDTKDVTIQADSAGHYAQSFLLTLKNRNWMKMTRGRPVLEQDGPHAREVWRRAHQEDRTPERASAARHALARCHHRHRRHSERSEDRTPLLHPCGTQGHGGHVGDPFRGGA